MLGLVGGLGPRATVAFYTAFMCAVMQRRQGEIPRLLMYNVAMSSTIENTFLQSQVGEQAPQRLQVRSLLQEAIDHFVRNQVMMAALPCNTLQDEWTRLCQAQGLGYLNMIDVTADAVLQAGAGRVLILGTTSTYRDDLYGRRLTAQRATCLYPTDEQQQVVEAHIRAALDQNLSQNSRPHFAAHISQTAEAHRADSIVLACTDLTGDLSEMDCGLPVFDSLHLLATAFANEALAQEHLFVNG